ncbi:hypothetical protein [Olleya marilimosa]|uniref:hypothetical protein n=1 Tax=Olleya marilimosa TaxID=272164 RepID=UPI000485E274|nr:hypothetical protein [Olleya marilimosa]
MKDILKFILKLILLGLIPALLIYISKSDYVLNYFIDNEILVTIENKDAIKFWLFFVGTLIGALIIPIKLFLTEKKLKKQKTILKVIVLINLKQIAKDLDLNISDLNIRVFRVKKNIFNGRVRLTDKHFNNITDKIEGKGKLPFVIHKDNIQGVVGRAYSEKSYFVDYNIRNDYNSYSLTDEHLSRIGDVKFCCATPIFNRNKIKYIISLDSIERVYKSKAKTTYLRKNLVYLSKLFDDFIL